VITLWRARRHLSNTLLAALGRRSMPEEQEEIFSYRTAYVLLSASGLYVMWWWYHSGLGGGVLVLALWFVVLFVGLSRAVAQGGMAYARSPIIPGAATLETLGVSRLGPEGMMGIMMTAPYAVDTRTTVMTSAANGLRLSEEIDGNRRGLGLAILIALVVSVAVSYFTVLYLPYKHGCSNLGGWGFSRGWHHNMFNWGRNQVLQETAVSFGQLGFMGVGAGLMGVLLLLQGAFHWWPIHPIGLALGYTYPVAYTWFSVFLAWLAKSILVWAGGSPLYLKARPLFIGLAVGGFVTAGFWAIAHAIIGHGAVRFTLV